MPKILPDLPEMLTPGEVASLLRVDPSTVTKYANKGKLRVFRTPGGHRRYYADEIRAIIEGDHPFSASVD